MPISGRLMTSSIRLPIHMEATMPQNRSGPFGHHLRSRAAMPWMIIAPIISAMTALDGRPGSAAE